MRNERNLYKSCLRFLRKISGVMFHARFGNSCVFCVVLVLIAAGISGCGEKEAKSMEEFQAFAQEQGYSLTDCTQQFESYGYIEQAWIAIAEDGSYQVEFYVLDSEESACVFYQENFQILSQYEENAKSCVKSSTSTVQNYEITGTVGFGCVTRIGKTCFFAVVDQEAAGAVKRFKQQFGY